MPQDFPLISHVDVRVRNRKRACAFYDALLLALGAKRRGSEDDPDDAWTSYYDAASGNHWFGFTVDPNVVPGKTRIGINVPDRAFADRLGAQLADLGARNIEPPDDEYGPDYYAYFFEDPDGNRLEIVALRFKKGEERA
jgi:catechol 2,3-dioxygenase-like lactoylglutathione lyase family enzyme